MDIDAIEQARHKVVDEAYEAAMRVIEAYPSVSPEERTYIETMLVERLFRSLYLASMSRVLMADVLQKGSWTEA